MSKDKKNLNNLSPETKIISEMFSLDIEARERLIQEHNSNPHRKIHLTPFGNPVPAMFKDGKTFGVSKWNCEETFMNLKKCLYDVETDPMCDHCIRCNKALERPRR